MAHGQHLRYDRSDIYSNVFNLHVHYYSSIYFVTNFKVFISLGCTVSSESPCMAAHVGTANFQPSLTSYELEFSFSGMSETCSTHGLEPGTNASSISAVNGAFSLENILGENHDAVQHLAARVAPATGWDEEDIERPLIEGYCVECEGNFYQ